MHRQQPSSSSFYFHPELWMPAETAIHRPSHASAAHYFSNQSRSASTSRLSNASNQPPPPGDERVGIAATRKRQPIVTAAAASLPKFNPAFKWQKSSTRNLDGRGEAVCCCFRMGLVIC